MELKNTVIIVIAVAMVLLFIIEPFAFGGGRTIDTPDVDPGKNATGMAVFNGTIRTYDPVLYLPTDSDQQVIGELRMLPGVLDVKTQTDIIAVQTDTRDDVFPTAAWLRERNISCFAIANIVVNGPIQVETAEGITNASLLGNVVRVVAEPLLDADSDVSVSMLAVVASGQIIDYSSASLLLSPVDILLDAEVESLDSMIFTYSIPWGERASLGNLSRFGEADYDKVDSIVFSPPLSVGQVMAKKQFPYIVYIDAGSAQVEPSFDNLTQLGSNFQDTPFTLPDSSLTIKSMEAPDWTYTPETSTYQYTLRLVDPPYEMGSDTLSFETDERLDEDASVQLNMSLLVLGDRVISVKRVSLPS
ncbi:MAG: hypothetical protein V1827_05260 [Candidatus Micrarchaeota archaeon]